jgi:hypothetical protein
VSNISHNPLRSPDELELADYLDENQEDDEEVSNLAVHTMISKTTTEQPSSEEKNILRAIVPRRSGLRPRRSSGPSLYAPSKRPAQNISGIDFFSVAETKRKRKKPKPDSPKRAVPIPPKRKLPISTQLRNKRARTSEAPKVGQRTRYSSSGLGRLGYNNSTFRR